MRRGAGALVGGLGRIRGLVGVGEAGGTGGTEGEADQGWTIPPDMRSIWYNTY